MKVDAFTQTGLAALEHAGDAQVGLLMGSSRHRRATCTVLGIVSAEAAG